MSKLKYAMVGGGQGAFIGGVHRKAIALDGQIELVAGALSSSAEKARASGRELGLADERNHASWEALLADELQRPASERIDFVSIVTPNHVHLPAARAALAAAQAALAQWLLREQPGWTRERIELAMSAKGSERVDLSATVPVILYYVTAAVMPEDGRLHFADDLYRHDAALERALKQPRAD